MKIIQPSFQIINFTPDMTRTIELAGRTCYRSEDKIGGDSDARFIEKLKSFHHFSVLEHGSITVRFICDRGVTHELVRHRIASFSQESTRYCAYNKDKFGGEITVIDPFFFVPDMGDSDLEYEFHQKQYGLWHEACRISEKIYLEMLENGASAQQARSVLPNSLKTEIIVTANVREWRTILEQRTHRDAHPQMRQIMVPLAHRFANVWSILFNEYADCQHPYPALEILGDEE